jgi:hypothetical protein
MGTLTLEMAPAAPLVLPREPSAMREEQIRVSVQMARASCKQPHSFRLERRLSDRDPFPYPVHLTPLSRDHQPVLAQTIIVIGRHLSEQGLDFYHHEPVPFRRAVVSLPTDGKEWVSFLFELFWTRYNCHGWYDNGGRFLAVVPPLQFAA